MLENFRTQKIIWDRANKKIFEAIEASSGDSNGRKLVVQVINQEATESLTGTTLSLGWKSRKGAKGLDAFNIVDASKGIFEIYYTTEMLSNIGNIEASLILIDSTSRIESSTFTISVRQSTVDDESIESENSFTALTEALVKVNDFDTQLAQKADQHDLLVERNRINQFVSLDEGSTTGDAELVDGRVGANGRIYDNIGEAIRKQNSDINKKIYGNLNPPPVFVAGFINTADGVYVGPTSTTRARTDLFEVPSGTKITASAGYEFNIARYASGSIDSFIKKDVAWVTEYTVYSDCHIVIGARGAGDRNISDEHGLISDSIEISNMDEISILKNETEILNKEIDVIFGEAEPPVFVTGLINTTDGAYADTNISAHTRARTNLFRGIEGTRITASAGYEFYVALYDSNSIESFTEVSGIWLKDYMIPYNCYFIIVARAEDNRDISGELLSVSNSIEVEHAYSFKRLYDKIEQPQTFNSFKNNLVQTFPVYTTLGDSLTAGYSSFGGITTGSATAVTTKNNWPGYLELRTGRTFNNIAVGGTTTKDWRNTHLSTADIETNAYIVALGVNDLRVKAPIGTPTDIDTSDNQLNSESFYGNYDYIIRELKKYNEKAHIFVMTIPSHESNPEPYNQVIRYISSLYENVHLLDMYNIYYSEFSTGFLQGNWNGHFTPMGYNYESSMVEEALNNYLYENYTLFQTSPYG